MPNLSRIVARAALAVVCAAALGARGGAQSPSPSPASLACANPRLPPAILAGPAESPAQSQLPTVAVHAPRGWLRLALADDEAIREQGLMCVTALRARSGMLFLFARAGVQEFWMKNTLIALDMIWVDPHGRVTTVAARVPASTLETPDSAVARRKGNGLAVIELGPGEAAAAGIREGTMLGFPRGALTR